MKLTKDEVETIRIHMSAFKEMLCNQRRWNEAQDYQNIVDKLDGLLTADSAIRCKDCIYHHGVWCTKNSYREFDPNDVVTGDDDYCSMAKRKEQ